MPNNDIVIDLSSSNHNKPISVGSELIQWKAFESLRAQIKVDLDLSASAVKEVGSKDNDLYPHGSGLTYFIDGTRGAGKSTFLSCAYEHLNSAGGAGAGAAKQGSAVDVWPMLYLDPSRIESSEIVLLHVLKRLKHIVEACSHKNQSWPAKHEEFRKLFQQMAGGLHLFVSKNDSLKDLDAELFLDYGLDRAADSQRLRQLLHRTIHLVCEMRGCRALLLAIDDADTKADLAMGVLECIRKYLDTPEIVVLVTGDMEMYSLLVQNHFQQDFASEDKGLNPDRKKQQTRMVEHLEEQYLLKLFPIQRRVQLKTLHTLSASPKDRSVGDGGQSYQVSFPGPSSPQTLPLNATVDRLAVNGLRLRADADKELFREHVLKLPVRSVLQLLSTYYKLSDGENSNCRAAACEALRAVALSSLYRHDADVESIAEGDLHAAIEAAFNLSLLDGEPDTATYLRPQSRDSTIRNASVSLAAEVARLCEKDPARAITFMLTNSGSSSIYYLVEKEQNKGSARTSTSKDSIDLQRKLKEYLSVGRKEPALNWAWHATAALIGATTSKGHLLRQGIVGVRTGSRTKANPFDRQLKAAIAARAVPTVNTSSVRAYPAIAFCQSGVKQYGNTQRYLSIFNLLGLIANLLAMESYDRGTRSKSILDLLNKVRNTPTVSLPNWKDLAATDSDDDDVDDTTHSDGSEEQKALEELVRQIEQWLETCAQLKHQFHPSAVLLGKIWNRLYFSLDNISGAMRSNSASIKDARCAKAMELFAWALINACLVEEVDYHHRDDSTGQGAIDRANPRTSGELVIKKFLKPTEGSAVIDVTPSIAPLAFMIASCPLVLGLIKNQVKAQGIKVPTKDFIDNLKTKLEFAGVTTQTNIHLTCEPAVWAAIGKTTVALTGSNPAAKTTTKKATPQAEATIKS